MQIVKIGTCGWSVKGGRKEYFKKFNIIELQNTFYELPKIENVKKLRKEAPEDFEFIVKVWQVLTHPPRYWKKAKIQGNINNYGSCKPTEENFKVWEQVLEICLILKCKICIFQTPPSFGYNENNLAIIKEFFTSIRREEMKIGWEPRGSWNDYQELNKVFSSLDLIHIVDPFKREPCLNQDITYYRLHGKNGEFNYKYRYTEEDLITLKNKIKNQTYVLFNNIHMAVDAENFKNICLNQ